MTWFHAPSQHCSFKATQINSNVLVHPLITAKIDSTCFSITHQQNLQAPSDNESWVWTVGDLNRGSRSPLRTYGRWLKQILSMKVAGFSPKIATGRGWRCWMGPQTLEPYVSLDWENPAQASREIINGRGLSVLQKAKLWEDHSQMACPCLKKVLHSSLQDNLT